LHQRATNEQANRFTRHSSPDERLQIILARRVPSSEQKRVFPKPNKAIVGPTDSLYLLKGHPLAVETSEKYEQTGTPDFRTSAGIPFELPLCLRTGFLKRI
jgi:hypothetical protein